MRVFGTSGSSTINTRLWVFVGIEPNVRGGFIPWPSHVYFDGMEPLAGKAGLEICNLEVSGTSRPPRRCPATAIVVTLISDKSITWKGLSITRLRNRRDATAGDRGGQSSGSRFRVQGSAFWFQVPGSRFWVGSRFERSGASKKRGGALSPADAHRDDA